MTRTLRSGTMPGWANPVGRGLPQRRAQLLDVRELRVAPAQCEMRLLRNGDLVATGYASTFEDYEVYGGPERYGWIERIDRNAFTKTMAAKPDVVYLVNHDGLPLARTKSGTLKLGVDDGGLAVEALLEPTDPDVQALRPKMERGDVDEMSFAFYVKAQEWDTAPGYDDDPYSLRTITELSIHRGDVSVVTFGANPTTSAKLGIVGQGQDGDQLLGATMGDSRHGGQTYTAEGGRGEGGTVIDLGDGRRAVLLGGGSASRGPDGQPGGAGGRGTSSAGGVARGVEQEVANRTGTVSITDARNGLLPDDAPDGRVDQHQQAGQQPPADARPDAGESGQQEGQEPEQLSLDAAKGKLGLRTGVGALRQEAGMPDAPATLSIAALRGR